MIDVIEGRGVGSGKSYAVVRNMMPHWLRGGTACISDSVHIKWDECKRYAADEHGLVLEDDQYRSINAEDLQRLHEVTPPGSDDLPVKIVVDEAQDAFNARDWSDKGKRPFFSWLCQSRHDDNDVTIVSQAAANVDKQIRRLCTFIYVTRNSKHFPVLGVNLDVWIKLFTFGLNDGHYFIVTTLDQDGHTKLGREWHKADKKLFKCYKSKSMALAHRRAGEAVARKQLAKTKRKFGAHPMIKFAIVGVVVLTLFCGYRVYAGKSTSQVVRESIQHDREKQGGKSAAEAVKAYDIKEATFAGGGFGEDKWLCTEEFGNLEVGEMSVLGMVEVIHGHRARIRKPDGQLVYVVATKPRPSLKPELRDTLPATPGSSR